MSISGQAPAFYFYPRSPCGERPGKVRVVEPGSVFLSTLSLRRATTGFFRSLEDHRISIHALLAESDGAGLLSYFAKTIFLSTLSLRRATLFFIGLHLFNSNFYPRSPCGERLRLQTSFSCLPIISIHALLAESDEGPAKLPKQIGISIHALLAESDSTVESCSCCSSNFYPRSPCGERRQQPDGATSTTYFYPRSPCGERQQNQRQRKYKDDFYPRSPCGERPAVGVIMLS